MTRVQGSKYLCRDAERLASRRDMHSVVTQLAGMDPVISGIMAERLASVQTTTKDHDSGMNAATVRGG